MNNRPESILVNSCQYTPVYLIQSPGGTQANYVIAQSNLEEQKPVSDNLKRFYENSGILENCAVTSVNSPKPRILKKPEGATIGNNLKLASFLLPKNENTNKAQYVVNNIVLKPPVTTSTINSTVNTIPKLDIDRKIVKLKEVPLIRPTPRTERLWPKIKPKENVSIQPAPTPTPHPAKHTSVQLLKLGETYHSLNQLSDEQMKMVNQALKIFSDPDKIAQEPTYDPVTNTRYLYKVVSPRDLTVVGKKKRHEIKKEPIRKSESDEEMPLSNETKVTRSGRKVRLPKQILPEEPPQKSKRKSDPIATCFQCYSGFPSLYKLQRHYETHPTHIPSRIHSNLFQCLMTIVKSGTEEHRTDIFIQQLEHFISKLKSLLPCLLNKMDSSEENSCTINDDVGRLLGMNPGQYNLDVDALDCVQDEDGYCKHNPPKPTIDPDIEIKPPRLWIPIQSEETQTVDSDSEDCARVNPVDQWPIRKKRTWKIKQRPPESNVKRMRINSENCDTLIDLGVENLVEFSQPDLPSATVQSTHNIGNVGAKECNIQTDSEVEPLVNGDSNQHPYAQFHSTHFDIRSSPMKPSSTVFHKFQINPDKLAQYQVQIIQPLPLKTNDSDTFTSDALQELLRDSVDITCKDNVLDRDLNLKEWIMNSNDKSDSFPASNEMLESSLYVNSEQKPDSVNNHANDLDSNVNNDRLLSNHGDSVLNFLESLGNDLAYPGTEIRNNPVDFQLDLFSFPNS